MSNQLSAAQLTKPPGPLKGDIVTVVADLAAGTLIGVFTEPWVGVLVAVSALLPVRWLVKRGEAWWYRRLILPHELLAETQKELDNYKATTPDIQVGVVRDRETCWWGVGVYNAGRSAIFTASIRQFDKNGNILAELTPRRFRWAGQKTFRAEILQGESDAILFALIRWSVDGVHVKCDHHKGDQWVNVSLNSWLDEKEDCPGDEFYGPGEIFEDMWDTLTYTFEIHINADGLPKHQRVYVCRITAKGLTVHPASRGV